MSYTVTHILRMINERYSGKTYKYNDHRTGDVVVIEILNIQLTTPFNNLHILYKITRRISSHEAALIPYAFRLEKDLMYYFNVKDDFMWVQQLSLG